MIVLLQESFEKEKAREFALSKQPLGELKKYPKALLELRVVGLRALSLQKECVGFVEVALAEGSFRLARMKLSALGDADRLQTRA